MAEGRPRFGEQPLPQTVAAAGAVRRLADLLLALEHEHPTVDAMLGQFAEWERELSAAIPADPTPRIGPDGTEVQRVYLDHAFDVGAYNPCFPEYIFDHLGADSASGRVTFPLVFEGPPGLVNGGFLAVFFDCVTQHPELRLGTDRQDPVADGHLPPADTDPHGARLRRHAVGTRGTCHVHGAAASGRRGAVHRRIQHGGFVAGQTERVPVRSAASQEPVTSVQRIRQPRVAEIVASRLREDILSGRIKEGDILPSQDTLLAEFGVSPPALREAIHILETDGLISVRRGNVGGAVVHPPSAERTAHMISMVLQTRSATPADVSGALMHLEPICAGMCAAREDRLTEVVPYLEAEIRTQTEQFDNLSRYVPNARRFHEAIVSRCGNEPMILLIGSLELIWSAHESSVWSDDADPMEHKTMRAALRDHQRLLDAIRDGNESRAVRLAQDHLAAARRNTLAVGADKTIEAKLISNAEH